MRIHAGIWTALLAMLLTATPVSAAPGDNQGRGEEQRSARAEAALEAAQDLFRPRGYMAPQHGPHARRTPVNPAAEHASLVLRDLALSLDDLEPEDRLLAQRLLARPSDGRKDPWPNVKYGSQPRAYTCSDTAAFCLHWVTKQGSKDAPNLTDSDGDSVPDWVEENQRVFEEVWQRIVVDLGYRPPVPDGAVAMHGPDERTDIYLADLGGYGMYGYCTVDNQQSKAAYCVMDEDFEEFIAPPGKSLRVTAAHEFFHAVQFRYNLAADKWLMEGTAAWIEDEVYDDINDNLQFLARSALQYPHASLDFIAADDYRWFYGSWIWWRFLAEKYGAPGKPDPLVIRQVWDRVGWGQGSLQAQRNVLDKRRSTFRNAFADFGAATRVVGRWYDEGHSYRRFVGRPTGRFTLTKERRDTGWKVTNIDHLSTKHAVLRPGKGLHGRWRLTVALDLPHRFRGSVARALVHRKDGTVRWIRVGLSRKGNARFVVAFNNRKISRVTLSLANASTRMTKCHTGTLWSCGGQPRDDGLTFGFRAHVRR